MSESASDLSENENLETLFSEGAIETDVKTLSALGYETRYRLVRLLVEVEDGLDFCDAGLVRKENRGRSRHYWATKRASALVAVLDGTR